MYPFLSVFIVFISSPVSPGNMDWSPHFPTFFPPNKMDDTNGQSEHVVEFADIGCGYGGLLGKIWNTSSFFNCGLLSYLQKAATVSHLNDRPPPSLSSLSVVRSTSNICSHCYSNSFCLVILFIEVWMETFGKGWHHTCGDVSKARPCILAQIVILDAQNLSECVNSLWYVLYC